MNNNIKLTKVNGEVIEAELINYFQFVDSGKKYIFYTLNEIVDNGLVKLYVSEVNEADKISPSIDDIEWNKIKNVMKTVLTGSEDANIKVLKWEA